MTSAGAQAQRLTFMDPERRKTLETLIELAGSSDASGCWDPDRAIVLLRRETNPEEAEELGASSALIEVIWPESRGR